MDNLTLQELVGQMAHGGATFNGMHGNERQD